MSSKIIRAGMALTAAAAVAIIVAVGSAQAKPTITPVAGQPVLGLGTYDLAELGYEVKEYFLSGTAASYKRVGETGADGHWTAAPDATAPYTTRIVVVRPKERIRFNGTVLVEWLNVSGGADASPDWSITHREILRNGYAYVGVSVQKVGIEGGPALVEGAFLKKADPLRYGPLTHPGDAFSFDIFSQAGFATRWSKILGPLKPKRILGAGESQSAVFLTTYINAIDPLAKAYDGYLVHSRFGGAPSIEGARIMGAAPDPSLPAAVKLRTDGRVPVITVVTETDVVGSRLSGFYGARQPDNDKLRIWEIAGTAHADNYVIAASASDSGREPIAMLAAALTPTKTMLGTFMDKPMNAAPQHHYVMQAALAGLADWVMTGKAPPIAGPLEAIAGEPGEPPSLALDANGNARGGIRTPWVDVPTSRMSGIGNSGGPFGFLAGVTEPFDAATLARLYPGGRSEYLRKFEAALDQSIAAGFILSDDRAEILALAAAMYAPQ